MRPPLYDPPITLEAIIPEHLRRGLRDYFNKQIPTGGFLNAVLEGDLIEAVRRADPISRRALTDIVMILLAEAPSCAWGSQETVRKWLEQEKEGGAVT